MERHRAVLAPKIDGLRHLDALTRGRDLAGFVAFGSAAATFGSPGQASYSAANAGMAAIVAERRARGEVGTCIAWGPWTGGGMAGSRDVQKNLRRLGIGLLDPNDALARLDEALWQDVGLVTVVASGGPGVQAAGPKVQRTEAPWIDQVRAVVARLLERPAAELAIDVPLGEMGVDSLVGIELRNQLTALSGNELPVNVGHGSLTIKELAAKTG
jgi:hypothetical protein